MLYDWYSLKSHYNNLNKRKKPVTKPECWTDSRGILKVVVACLCLSKVRLESKMGTSFNIKAKRLLATWFPNICLKITGEEVRTTLKPVHWSSLVKVTLMEQIFCCAIYGIFVDSFTVYYSDFQTRRYVYLYHRCYFWCFQIKPHFFIPLLRITPV